MLDSLTGLYNEVYLDENYTNYLTKHPDSKFIMIDFFKFKKINDTYGHLIGDKCLLLFAEKLSNYFRNDSIVARIHGDEFVVITNDNNNRILEIISRIDDNIASEAKLDIIPIKFKFNCGIVNALDNKKLTYDMADCMMYYAKKKDISIQFYDDEIYQNKLKQEKFAKELDSRIDNSENNGFSYYSRALFDNLDNKTNIYQVYTRNLDGSSILNGHPYESIRSRFTVSKFDYNNLKYLVSKLCNMDNNYIINIDYKSLFSIDRLIPVLDYIKCNNKNGLDNIILSIDLTSIELNEYDLVLKSINNLKKLGIKIKLNRIDNKIPLYLVEEINPDYIRVMSSVWKDAIKDNKKSKVLKCQLELFNTINNDINIIFEQVESSKEKEYLNNLDYDNTLYNGNYYSKERKLLLK